MGSFVMCVHGMAPYRARMLTAVRELSFEAFGARDAANVERVISVHGVPGIILCGPMKHDARNDVTALVAAHPDLMRSPVVDVSLAQVDVWIASGDAGLELEAMLGPYVRRQPPHP